MKDKLTITLALIVALSIWYFAFHTFFSVPKWTPPENNIDIGPVSVPPATESERLPVYEGKG